MSYDYLLGRGRLGDDPLSFMEKAMATPVGAVDDVKIQIGELFPGTRWKKPDFLAGFLPEQSLGHAVFGCGEPEFLLSLDEAGMVGLITMSRAAPEEVVRVARALGLVAVDEQSQEMFEH